MRVNELAYSMRQMDNGHLPSTKQLFDQVDGAVRLDSKNPRAHYSRGAFNAHAGLGLDHSRLDTEIGRIEGGAYQRSS